METLLVLFFGVFGFAAAIRLNRRIIELRREWDDTAHELRLDIARLERKIGAMGESASTTIPQKQTPPVQTSGSSSVSSIESSNEGSARERTQEDFPDVVVAPPLAISPQVEKPQVESSQSANSRSEKLQSLTLFGRVKNYFMTGNTLVKVGVILIFFGVSFLLKFAIDKDMIPIELRLICTAIFGIGLIKLGWNLRQKSRDYGLILQGGGIGILILTTFVSLKSYGLISAEAAFFLLVSFTAATAVLAVYQDSLNLAAFGFLGGFIAPILASTGQGQHVVLFSYYTILNLGIVFVSWKKAWRELNLLGFIFTFAIGTIWGVLKYQPEFYWSTQPFLFIFFSIYIAIPLLFASRREPELRGYVDGTIVFGNSLLTLALQLQLVHNIEYASTASALVLAGFYIMLSRYLLKHKNSNYRLLAEAFVSIGAIFTTVAIPLAFDGLKTSAIWGLEAAGIYWVSVRQNRPWARIFATFLIFATAVSFALGPSRGTSDLMFLNTFFMSCLAMAIGSYFVSYLAEKYKEKLSAHEFGVSKIVFVMGSLWWIIGGLVEVDRSDLTWLASNVPGEISRRFIAREFLLNVFLLYMTLGTFVVNLIGQKIGWRKFKLLSHGFVFILFFVFLGGLNRHSHPFENFGYLAWLCAFLVYYYVLFSNENKSNEKIFNHQNFDVPSGWYLKLGHAGALWILVGVFVRELSWLGHLYVGEASAWGNAAQGIMPILVIWFITTSQKVLPWPVQKHRSIYMSWGLFPICLISWFWLMETNWVNGGNSDPLPYFPLFNPLELSHLGLLFVMTIWALKMLEGEWSTDATARKKIGIFFGGTYFFWINGVLCRSIHQYVGVPFRFSSLFASVEVQVAFSLFWTLLGISIMIYASRKQYRWLWVTGAGLLSVVVFKMFLIDLSKTHTIARVISFIGVGILFLVVGYFSPIPPRVKLNEGKEDVKDGKDVKDGRDVN